MDTNNTNNEQAATVSPEIAEQVRLALVELLGSPPPALAGIPIELWLQRIVPVTPVVADLLSLTSETVLDKYRDKLIPLDGRKRFTGRLLGLEGERVRIATAEGEMALPLADLQRAKLVLTDELIATTANPVH